MLCSETLFSWICVCVHFEPLGVIFLLPWSEQYISLKHLYSWTSTVTYSECQSTTMKSVFKLLVEVSSEQKVQRIRIPDWTSFFTTQCSEINASVYLEWNVMSTERSLSDDPRCSRRGFFVYVWCSVSEDSFQHFLLLSGAMNWSRSGVAGPGLHPLVAIPMEGMFVPSVYRQGASGDGLVTPKLSFPCSQCDKVFNRKLGLQYHVKAIHENMTLHCVCGKTYSYETNMSRHQKRCKVHMLSMLQQ